MGRPVWTALAGLGAVAAASAAMALPALGAPQAANPEALFQVNCKTCHEPAIDRAPSRTDMAQRSGADITQVLTTGPMQPMASGMTADQVKALATFLSRDRAGGNPLTAGAAAAAPAAAGAPPARGPVGPVPPTTDKMCATNSPISAGKSDWTSWGIDSANSHYQKTPGLKSADVPKLKLKWAMSIRGSSYSAPTVIGDWMFFVSRGGGMYALDAHTGCVHWHNADVNSRTTPMIVQSKVSPSGWLTVLGAPGRVAKAYDLQTGKEIWTSPSLESHTSGNITGSPLVVGDQVFVPITSGEEGAGLQLNYPCCSFRGSVVALDLATGKIQWKTYTVTEPMHPTIKNPVGTQLQGPAGGAIWSSPTADPKKGVLYVATGDSYTAAPTLGADAIMAMDMKTGKIKWSTQVTKADNFLGGCLQIGHSANCPDPEGPDYDFGNPPIVIDLPGGKQVIASGQKSAIAYGMDADTGKLLWKTQVGAGSSLGGIEWGMASDGKRLYVPNSDIVTMMEEARRARGERLLNFDPAPSRPSVNALDPATGKILWTTPTPKAACKYAGDRSRDRLANPPCLNAQSAAVTIIPGALFSGATDGWFRAYDPATGKIIWEYSTTAQTYDTLNGVKGQPGGGIDSMGPTVANGMVYTFSGYGGSANIGGNPLNVLLAFSVDGK